MVKNIIYIIAVIIYIAAIIALALDTISTIVYFIYLWGGAGVAIGAAAWEAVKFWLLIVGIGIPTAIVSYIISKVVEK